MPETPMNHLLQAIALLTPQSSWYHPFSTNHSKQLKHAWTRVCSYTSVTNSRWEWPYTATLSEEKKAFYAKYYQAMSWIAEKWEQSGDSPSTDNTYTAIQKLIDCSTRASAHIILLNLHNDKSDSNGELYKSINQMHYALLQAIQDITHESSGRELSIPTLEISSQENTPTFSRSATILQTLFSAVAGFTNIPSPKIFHRHFAATMDNKWRSIINYPAYANARWWKKYRYDATLTQTKIQYCYQFIANMEEVASNYYSNVASHDETHTIECLLTALCQLIDSCIKTRMQLVLLNKQYNKTANNGTLQQRIKQLHNVLLSAIHHFNKQWYCNGEFDLLSSFREVESASTPETPPPTASLVSDDSPEVPLTIDPSQTEIASFPTDARNLSFHAEPHDEGDTDRSYPSTPTSASFDPRDYADLGVDHHTTGGSLPLSPGNTFYTPQRTSAPGGWKRRLSGFRQSLKQGASAVVEGASAVVESAKSAASEHQARKKYKEDLTYLLLYLVTLRYKPDPHRRIHRINKLQEYRALFTKTRGTNRSSIEDQAKSIYSKFITTPHAYGLTSVVIPQQCPFTMSQMEDLNYIPDPE